MKDALRHQRSRRANAPLRRFLGLARWELGLVGGSAVGLLGALVGDWGEVLRESDREYAAVRAPASVLGWVFILASAALVTITVRRAVRGRHDGNAAPVPRTMVALSLVAVVAVYCWGFFVGERRTVNRPPPVPESPRNGNEDALRTGMGFYLSLGGSMSAFGSLIGGFAAIRRQRKESKPTPLDSGADRGQAMASR